jgi:N-acetylglutamate synthase
MKIQRLTIDNYAEIINLWSKAKLPFRPKGRDSKKAIEAQMETPPNLFLGAYQGDHLVGVALLTCDGRKGWINRLAVDPEHRNRGIAKALIAESERVFREHGIAIFCSLIDDDNSASKELFKRCGYVEHHDIIYFSKRDSDEV